MSVQTASGIKLVMRRRRASRPDASFRDVNSGQQGPPADDDTRPPAFELHVFNT
jgi:hypothetical protein